VVERFNLTLQTELLAIITAVNLTGSMAIYPQRTNNMLEQFFRNLRRGHRRKSGNNSMHRVLQAMLADTPLIKNLENPKYMEILLKWQKTS